MLSTARPHLSSGFGTLGEQLLAIREAAIRAISANSRPDPRLTEINRRAQAAGGSEAVPSDGGFLIAPEFSRDILKRMYSVGDISRRCMMIPITAPRANALKMPQFDESSRATGSRLGGVQAYWANEADQFISSKPKFGTVEVKAEKVIGLLYLTDELLADSDALSTWAEYALALELNFALENKIVNGTGAGQPLGILNAPALVSVTGEAGQSSGTVNSVNVTKMLAAFWSASYNSPGSCFIYHQSLLPQLAALQTIVGSGGSESKMWQWATADDQYDLLAGFPAIQSEYCALPGSPGDIILADFSRYLVTMRGPIRNELSLHLQFLTDQAAFRAVLRVNGLPVDRTPVTPFIGTYATSPFVALAQR